MFILLNMFLCQSWFHQEFQVPKMEVLNLIRLFWGWFFPYISRIHTAYIDEDPSILGTFVMFDDGETAWWNPWVGKRSSLQLGVCSEQFGHWKNTPLGWTEKSKMIMKQWGGLKWRCLICIIDSLFFLPVSVITYVFISSHTSFGMSQCPEHPVFCRPLECASSWLLCGGEV